MDSDLELEVGLTSQRKRPFLQEGRDEEEVLEAVDRISDLPDHIIARLLSFLETEEAVRTSILSSRWRHLWKGITRIHLWNFESDPDKFSNLVEHVLGNCISSNFLAFELRCPELTDVSCLNSWVRRIVSNKIEKLILWANNTDDYDLPEFPLPQCILSYTTLIYLELNCFDIQIPESVVNFPCLKTLDLHVVFPDNEAVVNRLLSCCPVLEKLDLFGFIDLDSHEVLRIDIYVSTLKRFDLRLKSVPYSNSKKHEIVINTPKLEYLSIDDDTFARYVVKNLPRVSNVFVNYEEICSGEVAPECINRLFELFKGIAAIELLTLHWNTVDVLRSALGYTWPTFPYLMTLILHLSVFSGWTCFSKVLHSVPSLEFLILDLEGINDCQDRQSRDEDVLYQWTPPDTVPNCLLEHLEVIGIQYFQGNKDELQVVEYLLNNAQVLECMMIGYDPSEFSEEGSEEGGEEVSEEVRKKLLLFPRASKTCEVEIYERLHFENDLHKSLTDVVLWGV